MNKTEKIVVVDLDKTLLLVDSFNLFLSIQLKRKIIRVGLIRALRKLRLLSSAKFKKWISKFVYDILPEEEKLSFILLLANYLNKELLNSINNKYSTDCRIIIISASLDQYVQAFAQTIGWEGFGSYTEKSSGKFMHLHGKGKSDFLLKYFPSDKYTYQYSISDSQSDLPLLKLFKHFDLFKENL